MLVSGCGSFETVSAVWPTSVSAVGSTEHPNNTNAMAMEARMTKGRLERDRECEDQVAFEWSACTLYRSAVAGLR